MSAAPALLAAIRDRPDDDTPRLAYADWLDDAGDATRADFVRVQVQLARLPDHDPARPALEDREHELLAAHEPAWLGVPPGALMEWDWQRGFVEEVTTGPDILQEFVGRALLEAHPIRRWRPTDPGSRLGALAAVAATWGDRIEVLDLRDTQLSPDQAVELLAGHEWNLLADLAVHANPVIRRLAVERDAIRFRGRLRSFVAGSDHGRYWLGQVISFVEPASLTHLDVSSCAFTGDGLTWLLTQPSCRNLTRLGVADTDIAPNSVAAFARAAPALTALDVSGTPLAAFALEPLLNAPALAKLRELSANRCGSAAAVVRALLGSPFWSQAETLRLADATAPTRLVEPLFAADGPAALRTLDLSNNFLYDAGVADLCNANWSGSLTWLGLGRNYLTDTAAERIAASGRFRQLRTLHLSYNHPRWLEDNDFDGRVTDRGAVALASSPGLAALRVLTLTGVSLSAAGVDALLNGPFWRLSGLGLGRCELTAEAVRVLAASPRLTRLSFLDLSGNRDLRGDALRPLAESPYLSPLLELDIHGCGASEAVGTELRSRLGRRVGL